MIPFDFKKLDTRKIDGVSYDTYRVDMIDYNGQIHRGFQYDVYVTDKPDVKLHTFIGYPIADDIREVVKTLDNV